MSRRKALGAGILAVLAVTAAWSGTARAVFPGAAGRLAVNYQLFDPPATSDNPVLSYSPMNSVRFSPDAGHVVGMVGPGGSAAIYVANADGSDQHAITTPPSGGGDSGPTWSPDGKEVAFVRVSGGSQQLLAVNLDTGATRALSPASDQVEYFAPDWSPDPDSHELVDLVYNGSCQTKAMPFGVALISTDTGATIRCLWTSSNAYPAPVGVRFAPDASSVVIGLGAPMDPAGSAKIITVPLGGGAGVSFPVSHPGGTPPTFTPDGLWVTFVDCRPGCGIWSRSLPHGDDPGGQVREDVSYSGAGPSAASLDWEPLVNTPVITAGPSGRVGTSTATFEFSIPSTEQGTYQCRLDQGGWEDDCKSPKTYDNLADGDHTFDVRFYVKGQNPEDAPIASRSWTVDTTPPEAIVDQAPSGKTTSTDAAIYFHSTEPGGATFVCSEDGGPEYDCSSPENLSGLAVGSHTFAVKAIDDVGNEQQSATQVSWEVVEPQPGSGGSGGTGGVGGSGAGTGSGGSGSTTPPLTPSGGCGKNRFAKVSAGAIVAIGRGGTCFVRVKKSDGSIKWVAAGPISLNGVQLDPSGPLTLDQYLSSISLELPAGTTLGFESFTWTLPGSVTVPISTAGSAAHFVLPNQKQEFEIARIKVAGKADFELSSSDGGSATVSVELELPEIFKGVAGGKSNANGLTFAFKFIASNDKGVRFSFKASVSGAWLFGKVELSKLSVGLDQGPPLTFDGTATFKFPGVDGKFSLSLGLSGDGEQAFPKVTKLALQASELQKPIAEGVFLQRLGGQFTRCTGSDGGELSANAGISFGPKLTVPGIFEGEPASLDGTVTLSLCEPKSVAVKGTGKIVEVQVGQASAKYAWSKGRIDLSGQLDLTIAGWGFVASIDDAFFDMPSKTWNVGATGQLRLPAIVGGVLNGQADVVVSSNGLAACLGKPGHQAGIAKHWGQDLQKFFDSCDVGPYRAGTARAAAAGAAQPVTIPNNDPVALLAVHGSSAPPKLSLTGPGGVRIESPADGSGLQTAHGLLVPDAASHTTYVVLSSPAAGTWTVTPDPLTVGGISVQVADGLPDVRVHARVRRAGQQRLLTWKLRRIAGQKVTFVEHGSSTDRALVSTSRVSGRLRFTPAAGPGGRRQIVALVTEHGLPRRRLVVAHFTAPPPPKLRAVSGLRRRGATLRWRRQPAAVRYSMLLRAPSGATLATTTRHAQLPVPRAMRRATLTVTITALDAAGNIGSPRTRVLTP